MPDIMNLYTTCTGCNGTGVRVYWDQNHNQITEDPCSICEGSKLSVSRRGSGVDATLILDILDKCNDILDKCNDIFEKVNV